MGFLIGILVGGGRGGGLLISDDIDKSLIKFSVGLTTPVSDSESDINTQSQLFDNTDVTDSAFFSFPDSLLEDSVALKTSHFFAVLGLMSLPSLQLILVGQVNSDSDSEVNTFHLSGLTKIFFAPLFGFS